jgi:hypothetical protein
LGTVLYVTPNVSERVSRLPIFVRVNGWVNDQSLFEFHLRSQQLADTMGPTLEEQRGFLEQLSDAFVKSHRPVTREEFCASGPPQQRLEDTAESLFILLTTLSIGRFANFPAPLSPVVQAPTRNGVSSHL